MRRTAPSSFASIASAVAAGVLATVSASVAIPAAAQTPAARSGTQSQVPAAKRSAARAAPVVAAREPVIEDATPDQVKAADLVFYGRHDCEFDQSLNITQSPKHSAYVELRSGKSMWLMKPVLSSTGAIRLEDVRGQTLLVQIAAKSMLLDVKAGKRLNDECVCDKQRELLAEAKAAKAAAQAAPVKAREEAALAAEPTPATASPVPAK